MFTHLTGLIPGFCGKAYQCRCFAHILNLVVKSILQLFGSWDTKSDQVLDTVKDQLDTFEDELDLDSYPINEDIPDPDFSPNAMVDVDVDEELQQLLVGMDISAVRASVHPVRLVLVKVCCQKCYSSVNTNLPTALQDIICCLQLNNITPSRLEGSSCSSRPTISRDASGCTDTLEFYCKHGHVCLGPLATHQ
jgi:hypothetical protein